MPSKVKVVQEGMHTITPQLIVRDGMKALEFYRRAFGAEVKDVSQSPGGKLVHAELNIGGSRLMLGDEFPGMGGYLSPLTLGGTSITINIFTANVDQLFNRAVGAGATVIMPPANQFWGDRYGQVQDPFGHTWTLAQEIEDVAPDEVLRRARAASGLADACPGNCLAAIELDARRAFKQMPKG